MIDIGENIIIIWMLDKSRSVVLAKLEIKLVSPYIILDIYNGYGIRNLTGVQESGTPFSYKNR